MGQRAASWWAALERRGRPAWLAALSLLLLVAQQGAYLHELSHHLPHAGSAGSVLSAASASAGSREPDRQAGIAHAGDRDRNSSDSSDSGDHDGACSLCLAFAGVDALATSAVVEPLLLTGLHHAWGPATAFAVRPGIAPAPRNRGPPI